MLIFKLNLCKRYTNEYESMRIGNTINLIDFFLAIKIRLFNTPRAKQSPKATQIDAFLRDEGGGGGRVAIIFFKKK